MRQEIQQEFEELLKHSSKVIVFWVKIDEFWDDDFKFETALRLLPFNLQSKIISKKFTIDAKTSLANLLLQFFISGLLTNKTDISSLRFGRNQYGKPYLEESNFTFSMSNQQGYTSMVVDLMNSEIGIDLAHTSDVERFGDTEYLDHFRDIFHDDEYQKLRSTTSNDDLKLLFTQYWALKESYTKKLGIGLNGDLASYNFKNTEILSYNKIVLKDTKSNHFKILNGSLWNNKTKLFIYDNLEDLDIQLCLIEPKLVVAVCGDIPDIPTLVEVSIPTILGFFKEDQALLS